MKKNLIFLVLILFPSVAIYAQYGGYNLTIAIKTVDNLELKGYSYVASNNLNLDSLDNLKYIITHIDQGYEIEHPDDSFSFFKTRLQYDYGNYDPNQPLFYLIEPIFFKKMDIKSIAINSMSSQSTMIGISSKLTISDTSWLQTDTIASFFYEGFLCSHKIFIHSNSKKTEEVIERLDLFKSEVEKMGRNFNNQEMIDEELWRIVNEFQGQKVLVVSECSC